MNPPRLVIEWFEWNGRPWWQRAWLRLTGRGFWRRAERGELIDRTASAATLTEKDLRDCFERENGYPLPDHSDGDPHA